MKLPLNIPMPMVNLIDPVRLKIFVATLPESWVSHVRTLYKADAGNGRSWCDHADEVAVDHKERSSVVVSLTLFSYAVPLVKML